MYKNMLILVRDKAQDLKMQHLRKHEIPSMVIKPLR